MTDWEGREKGSSCTESGGSSPLRATKSDGLCKSEGTWLIEGWDSRKRAFKAGWWTADGENGGWTYDSDRALRFARECDAQAYIDNVGWTAARPVEAPRDLRGARNA